MRLGTIKTIIFSHYFLLKIWVSGKERPFLSYCLKGFSCLFPKKVKTFPIQPWHEPKIVYRAANPLSPTLEYMDSVALPWQEHGQSERSYLPQPLWAPGCVKCLVSRRHRVGGGAAREFRSGVTPEGRRGCCQSTCLVLPGSLIISVVENCFLPEDAQRWLHYGVNRRGD